jgi:hypothetical protein
VFQKCVVFIITAEDSQLIYCVRMRTAHFYEMLATTYYATYHYTPGRGNFMFNPHSYKCLVFLSSDFQ